MICYAKFLKFLLSSIEKSETSYHFSGELIMNCSSCGANLPYGANACPLCGTPVANNPQQIDPTVAAGPSYGGPSQTPPTAYGEYGAPPPPPPQNQYGGTPPPQNQYGPPPVQNQYGSAPPPVQPGGYGQPMQPMQPGGYGQPMQPMQPGGYGVPQQPPKKSNTGMIVGIVLGSILLVCVIIGIIVAVVLNNAGHAVVNSVNNAAATFNASSTQTSATLTALPTVQGITPSTGGTSPSGTAIDPTAAAIITNPQTASAIDSNGNPTTTASTFTVNQTIYVTFGLQLNGSTGYVQVKWYVNNQLGISKILPITDATAPGGYFSETYKVAAAGAAELYWCSQSDCSDAALAQFVTFTVSTTGSRSVIHPPIASAMDINRPD
jgi:hypothetical protein